MEKGIEELLLFILRSRNMLSAILYLLNMSFDLEWFLDAQKDNEICK